jgi:hypothetical protein
MTMGSVETSSGAQTYLAEARRACERLALDVREQLLEDLAEQVREIDASGLDITAQLGEPAGYVTEWLEAAGLVPAPPASRRRVISVVAVVTAAALVGAGVWWTQRPTPATAQMKYAHFAEIVDGQNPAHKGIPIHASSRPTGDAGSDGLWHAKTWKDAGKVELTAGTFVLLFTCAGAGYVQGFVQLGDVRKPIATGQCTKFGVTLSTYITLSWPAAAYAIEVQAIDDKIAAFSYSVMPGGVSVFRQSDGMDVRVALGV